MPLGWSLGVGTRPVSWTPLLHQWRFEAHGQPMVWWSTWLKGWKDLLLDLCMQSGLTPKGTTDRWQQPHLLLRKAADSSGQGRGGCPLSLHHFCSCFSQKELLAGKISKNTIPSRPKPPKLFPRSSVFLWRVGKSRPTTMGSLCSKQDFPTEPCARPIRKYGQTNPSRDNAGLISSADNSENQVRARGQSPIGVPNSDGGSSQSTVREKSTRTAPRSKHKW